MDERLQRPEPPMIRGSWEDLFAQAQEIGIDDPEEAIRLYRRVFSGLGQMPRPRRLAGNGQLEHLYRQSTFSLVLLLNSLDRFEDALDVLSQAAEREDEDQSVLREMMVSVLILDNRLDDAHNLVRQLVRDDQILEASVWEPLTRAYVQAGRRADAAACLAEAQSWLDQRYGLVGASTDYPDTLTDEARGDIAGVVWLRGLFAIATQQWSIALDCFLDIVRMDAPQLTALNDAYSRFVAVGRYEEAEDLIRQDTAYPIRAGFWRGLIEQERGHPHKAIGHWKHVSGMKIEKEVSSIVEFVFSGYHLGDPDSAALDMVEYLIDEMPVVAWPLHFAAGVGQLLHGDAESAHMNLQNATSMRKSIAVGLLLPYEYYLMARRLPVDPGLLDELKRYFESEPQPLPEDQ